MNLVDEVLKDDRCWSVYVHTNMINGKMYIGITSQSNPENRWRSNGCGYKSQPFYYAIEKYGWGNFNHEIVASNLTCDEANEFEIVMIRELNTLMKNGQGYNTSEGGKGVKGVNIDRSMYTGENALNTKKIICLNNMKVYASTEIAQEEFNTKNITPNLKNWKRTKFAGRDAMTGEKLLWEYYYEDRTEEEYMEIYKIKLENLMTHKSTGCKGKIRRIMVVNENMEFESINKCAIHYSVKPHIMAKWLNGYYDMPQEFKDLGLMYYEDYIKLNKESEAV